MLQTLKNAWRIEDLRKKILYTLFIVFIFRLGSAIPVPFVDFQALRAMFDATVASGSMLALMNVFTGGGLASATVFAMGISPYINASIILQLLTVAIPALERIVKEGGEEGKKKIAQWTRYLTVILGLVQGYGFYVMISSWGILTERSWWAGVVIVLTFTAGTALLMWLGERITENGIGNGISIILFAGIVSRGPQLVMSLFGQFTTGKVLDIVLGVLMIVVGLAMVVMIVFMSNAERRIPIQYAKRVVGRKMYGGQSTHLPIKVNATGVLPIIFASSILALPATIGMFLDTPAEGSLGAIVLGLFEQSSPFYIFLYALLIFAFSYFYASIQFNPVEIANNLKQNGGFIPGFRPGRPTAEFITKAMSKVLFVGAIFLCVIALVPLIIGAFSSGLRNIAIGGTSVVIVVGVALETVQQIEAQLMMRHHKGFLE
ncbi:MAG: preprotein translocase subunit SecY [Oscillospiraceae bacterium]|nr:preprotein translocase subunit SecY [Oscillospiraceae bacterium]